MPDGLRVRDGEEAAEVRRRRRSDLSDLDHNESWFSDMAERGLFLDRFEERFVWFKRETPRRVRYRMDVLSRELTEDELLLYDSAGWHFAATAKEEGFRKDIFYYVFQTDENAGVPELHTDPMEQAESLKRLYRKLLWSFWLMPAAVGFVYWMWFEPGQPERVLKRMVEGEPLGVYFVFLTALNAVNVLRGWLNVRRLRKRLAGGEPLDHRTDYRRAHRRFRLTEGLRWTLVGWLIAMMVTQLIAAMTDRALPLPRGKTDFPAVRLEEVYGGALAERGVSGDIYHEWTIAGAVIDRLWEEGNAREDNSILRMRTVCIRLPFVRTAERAFAALTETDAYKGYRLAGVAPVETDLADEVWAAAPSAENRNQFVLLARDGRQIVMLFYLDRTDSNLDAPEAAAFRDKCVERILSLLAERLGG